MHIQVPEAFEHLFDPRPRYIVDHGGRGSAKSISVARRLILRCLQGARRILCTRELQSSIADSVHRTLADEIVAMGLEDHFKIEKAAIYGPNASEFMFKGLRFNISEIKSTKGVTDVWIEEAQIVSKHSFEILDPTIREPGSQIFMTFNAELEEDYIFDRFVTGNTVPNGQYDGTLDAIVTKTTWRDNPFFPDVLEKLRQRDQFRDPDGYLTVWEGHPRQALEGAVYANEMRLATAEERITTVPYDRSKPVSTFWDLGRRDQTAIWFAQIVGFEFRIIDFHQDRGHSLSEYLKVIQEKPYVYAHHWLPHDARNKQLTHPLSIEGQMREAGFPVKIVPNINVNDGINAARTIFPNCWFDREKVADGVQALRRYRYEVKEGGHYSQTPLHDEFSDAADGFRYLAVCLSKPEEKKTVLRPVEARAGGWMSR